RREDRAGGRKLASDDLSTLSPACERGRSSTLVRREAAAACEHPCHARLGPRLTISHFMPARRRAATQAPDESDWNFIAVPPDELHWCMLWEYARSSPESWIETTVEAWFN